MGSANLAVESAGTELESSESAGDVVVDPATLRIVDLGAKGTGYSVRLVGRIDDAWIRCFRSVQADSKLFSRFGLDPRAWSVSFLRLADDGPADVIAALEALDSFVSRVNRFTGSS